MPETSPRSPFPETFAEPQALFSVPVGLASPLWALFAGAALSGSAWWWMTRWTRPENLEAMFAAAVETAAAEAHLAAPALEAADEAAVEAVVEPPLLKAPVGGESAPFAPALLAEMPVEKAPTPPKPRGKKAEPKSE